LPTRKFFSIDVLIMKDLGHPLAQSGVVVGLSPKLFKLIQTQFSFLSGGLLIEVEGLITHQT